MEDNLESMDEDEEIVTPMSTSRSVAMSVQDDGCAASSRGEGSEVKLEI